MQVAQLVLEYVRALAWPSVVGVGVLTFRRQIAAKIQDLTGVDTPVGSAKFDREAKEVEELADRATARQDRSTPPPDDDQGPASAGSKGPTTPPRDSSPTRGEPDLLQGPQAADEGQSQARHGRAPEYLTSEHAKAETELLAFSAAVEQLSTPPDFAAARAVASTSPKAAVMLAYSELEKIARAVGSIRDPGQPSRPGMVVKTVKDLGIDPDFVRVARELGELRNRVTHDAGDVSMSGAMDFILACERLTEVLFTRASLLVRHPSRSQLLRQFQELFEPTESP